MIQTIKRPVDLTELGVALLGQLYKARANKANNECDRE